MTEKNNNLSTVFEGNDVQIIVDENDELLFELYSTGAALGYARPNAKGMMYPRKDRIDTVIENAEISMCVRSGHKYLTESQLYDFMLEARTDKCKPFRKWVTNEVLPTIRKTGCYITESAVEESIDYQSKYGIRRIRKTFNESDNPRKTYEEYLELSKVESKAKRINNKDRIKASKIIIDTLQDKIANEVQLMRPSELLGIQELLTDIYKEKNRLDNKANGGIKASLTKRIKVLEDEVNYSTADYYCIPRHAYTCNTMNVYNEQLRKEVNSHSYKRWKENLNLSDFLPETYPGVDFSGDLKITLLFAYKKEFDLDNLQKTIIDQIKNFYGFNDNNIKEIKARWLETVDTYEDGKIWIRIENFVDDDSLN